MKRVILTCIFIPSILFFALFFGVQLAMHDLNMGTESSFALYWRNFKQIWYTSAPFYAMVMFLVFYVVLMFSVSRKQGE